MDYHHAYDLGMPRLSCVFCIFAPESALLVAGKHNPDLLKQYVAVEEKIGHSFKAPSKKDAGKAIKEQKGSLSYILEKLKKGDVEGVSVDNWSM